MEWKDATRYSQGDRLKGKEPNAWKCKLNGTYIWIGTGHIYNKGRWSLTCPPWFDATDFGPASISKEDAQAAAIGLVSAEIKLTLQDLDA